MYTHTIDPIMFEMFGWQIRWYGFLFMLAVPVGYYVIYVLLKKRNKPYDEIQLLVIMMIIGVVVGARIFHIVFYSPEMIWEDPLRIFQIWKGGVASHGALAGTLLGCWLYSRFKRAGVDFWQTADVIYTTTPLVSIFVRLGNFINSEIVGRATESEWGVKFVYYYYRHKGLAVNEITDRINRGLLDYEPVIARHPTQLYEMGWGIMMFVILFYLAIKKKDRLPDGALFGIFLIIFWLGRFIIEFFKEFQTLSADQSALTMGQYLSIPAVAIGGLVLWYSYYRQRRKELKK